MPEELRATAELLTGCVFVRHPENPTLGVLRLDTRNGQLWVLVTRKGLLALAKACEKHANDLIEAQ